MTDLDLHSVVHPLTSLVRVQSLLSKAISSTSDTDDAYFLGMSHHTQEVHPKRIESVNPGKK